MQLRDVNCIISTHFFNSYRFRVVCCHIIDGAAVMMTNAARFLSSSLNQWSVGLLRSFNSAAVAAYPPTSTRQRRWIFIGRGRDVDLLVLCAQRTTREDDDDDGGHVQFDNSISRSYPQLSQNTPNKNAFS